MNDRIPINEVQDSDEHFSEFQREKMLNNVEMLFKKYL